MGFPNGSDVGCERQRGVNDYCEVWACKTRRMELPLTEIGKMREADLGRDGRKGGFPGGSDGKEPTCQAGDSGSIPELGRSAGE